MANIPDTIADIPVSIALLIILVTLVLRKYPMAPVNTTFIAPMSKEEYNMSFLC